MEHQEHRGGVVWPVILIGLGLVFLLTNLGTLDWGIWEVLLRLWPVLLIGVGLEILIGRRSRWGSLVVALALLVVLAGAILLYRAQPIEEGQLVGEEISQTLQGASSAEVTIDFAVGELEIDALRDGDRLIAGTIEVPDGARVVEDFHVLGDTAHYALGLEGGRWSFFLPQEVRWDWSLGLTPEIPLDLTVDAGVGKFTLDLSGLQLTELDIEGGVGQVLVTLPAQGRLEGRIRGGVGEVVVTVPEGMAIRVTVDSGITGVSTPAGLLRSGDTYTSPGFDSAENRAELVVEGGVGRIAIDFE